MNYFERLKQKWGIASNFQAALIFLVFGLTGSASVWLAKPVLQWLGIHQDLSPWIRIPLRIVLIFPIYQVVLLLFGAIFGQFHFFFNLQKKWFRLK